MATEAMSGADAAWFHMDRDRNLMIVNVVVRFDGRPEWDAVEAVLADVVTRFPRLRQRAVDPLVTLGLVGPRWEDDPHFDLGCHLTRTALRAGTDAVGPDPLDAHLAARAVVPLDPGRPLWQAELIDVDDGSAALLLRTHHALADGAGLMKVVAAATVPLAEVTTPAARSAPRRRPPFDAATVQREAGMLAKLGGRLVRRGSCGTPLTAPLAGSKQVARCAPVALADLAAAGRETGSTVNDVYLAAVTGALRAHVAAGADAEDLDVIVPVSVATESHAAGDGLGNHFGLVFVRLPVSAADRRARLRLITERTGAIKSSAEPEVVFAALSAVGRVPRAAERAWVDGFINDAVAVVTNVSGPPHAVSLAGTPVAGMALLVPTTGSIGLGISLLTYDGRATVSLIADEATLPSLPGFAAGLAGELRRR